MLPTFDPALASWATAFPATWPAPSSAAGTAYAPDAYAPVSSPPKKFIQLFEIQNLRKLIFYIINKIHLSHFILNHLINELNQSHVIFK